MDILGVGKKKKDETAADEKQSATPVRERVATTPNYSGILLKPRITEKAAKLMEQNVYTFEVHPKASKGDIKEAVRALYNVTPIAVRIVNMPRTRIDSPMRRRRGMRKQVKKALVELKEGERIELM